MHFKFHKVVQRHYSGEVGNVYVILWLISSENYTLNFIKVASVFKKILQSIKGVNYKLEERGIVLSPISEKLEL